MKLNFRENVKAPVERVFSAYADFQNAASRIEGIEDIEILTEGPIGRGTRFRETRIMFGREATEEMEITEFESGKRYAIEADSCGSRIRTVFQFEPKGETTDVNVELTATAQTLFAKVMWPLGVLKAGPMKKVIQSDILQVKKYCESQPT